MLLVINIFYLKLTPSVCGLLVVCEDLRLLVEFLEERENAETTAEKQSSGQVLA
jgi:hypothetical protein